MTITVEPSRNEYTAAAGQNIFNFTFKIFSITDLNVYVTPVNQEENDSTDLTTDYTVAGVGLEDGGSITLIASTNAGDLVTIVSNIPSNRTTDYQNNGDFRPDVVNDDFDRVVSIAKKIEDNSNRSVLLNQSKQGNKPLVLESPIPRSSLRWSQDGRTLENFNLVGFSSLIVFSTPFSFIATEGQTVFVLPAAFGTEPSVDSVNVNGEFQDGVGNLSIGRSYNVAGNTITFTEELREDDLVTGLANQIKSTKSANPSESPLGTRGNPIPFNSQRELLNTDLSSTTFVDDEFIETFGRGKINDGGGAIYQIKGFQTPDFETILPLNNNFTAVLINGPRLILHNVEIERIAHRGFRGFNVQGTVYAFEYALDYGANSLEGDIQFTSDNEMVIFHDKGNMNVLMNGISGTVKTNTLAAVQAATFKELTGNILVNKVFIPEFFELLNICRSKGCLLHIEIKDYVTQTTNIDQIVQLIVDYGLEQSVRLQSFRISDIEYVRSINSDIKVGFIISGGYTGNDIEGTPKAEGFEFIKRDKNAMLIPDIGTVDNPPVFPDPTVAEFQAAGVEVVVYITDSSNDSAQGFEFARRNNVNGIMSDLPYFYNQPVRIKHGTFI